jgi:hypothetical protein
VISRHEMERIVRKYYDGCNEANAEKMIECFAPDAVHYFPSGAPQGTFFGAIGIATGWQAAVARLDSRWTIDRLLIDERTHEVAIEWTHFKPASGTYLRGAELCRLNDDGLIEEISAFYACPAPDAAGNYELGDFDYPGRGYPLAPPTVERQPT